MFETLECTAGPVSMPSCRNRISYGNDGVVVSLAEACGNAPGLWLEIAVGGDAPLHGAAMCPVLPLASPDEDRVRFAATVCAWTRVCRELAVNEGQTQSDWFGALMRAVTTLGVGNAPLPAVSAALLQIH